ncbi:MAG: peptidase [Sandaracinus sp.]|nr:peptidase [Sandaracinus sp.]
MFANRALGFSLILSVTVVGCGPCSPDSDFSVGLEGESLLLREERLTHETAIHVEAWDAEAPPEPPDGVFEVVRYPAPLGENLAYVSPVRDAEPGPAIVWIVGGFYFGLTQVPWAEAPRSNDQSGRAFREAGIPMMYPSLRGSMGNPGERECFFGEVDDVIAAVRFLATRPDVDPERVYVGGHSTGGTMALLVAESTDEVAGVIALGPVADPRGYGGSGCLPTDLDDGFEAKLRAPVEWVEQIRVPTVVVEGSDDGNADALALFEEYRGEAPVRLVEVPGLDHFSVIAPALELLAARVAGGQALEVSADAIRAASNVLDREGPTRP